MIGSTITPEVLKTGVHSGAREMKIDIIPHAWGLTKFLLRKMAITRAITWMFCSGIML